MLWLRDEAPRPQNALAVIWYSSDYAAETILRWLEPRTNIALAERAVALYGARVSNAPMGLR